MKEGVIIQASSRSNGDTSKVVSVLKKETGFDVIDLNQKSIAHFDYEFKNKEEIRRRLRKMKMAVVSCSNENEVFERFEMPFEKSAEYLGMDYLGHLHTWIYQDEFSEEVSLCIEQFAKKNVLNHV